MKKKSNLIIYSVKMVNEAKKGRKYFCNIVFIYLKKLIFIKIIIIFSFIYF
jgi:hypothetical protein